MQTTHPFSVVWLRYDVESWIYSVMVSPAAIPPPQFDLTLYSGKLKAPTTGDPARFLRFRRIQKAFKFLYGSAFKKPWQCMLIQ